MLLKVIKLPLSSSSFSSIFYVILILLSQIRKGGGEDGRRRLLVQGDSSDELLSRLRRIVTCIGPNQKNQPNLDLYLVRRYRICHFPIVVSYLCIGQNQKNQPNLVLYWIRRSKIFVSVATLSVVDSYLVRNEATFLPVLCHHLGF